VQEVVWDPEPVWTQRLEEKSSASVRDRTPAVIMNNKLKIKWNKHKQKEAYFQILF
jgi:hypothetical protein